MTKLYSIRLNTSKSGDRNISQPTQVRWNITNTCNNEINDTLGMVSLDWLGKNRKIISNKPLRYEIAANGTTKILATKEKRLYLPNR